jgi:hypothetical protein
MYVDGCRECGVEQSTVISARVADFAVYLTVAKSRLRSKCPRPRGFEFNRLIAKIDFD